MSTPPVFPGFGLPLDFEPQPPDPMGEGRVLFPSALPPSDDYDSENQAHLIPMLTLREIAMLKFMNEVTDKKDWERKVFEEHITEKWRTEIVEQKGDFTQKMIDYCLEELKYKAELYKETGWISLFHGDVVKSDIAIPKDLKEALKAAVAPLENIPEKVKDWHPESDEMVLDLVHPSLFPLVYGSSHIFTSRKLNLQTCMITPGTGEIVPVPEYRGDDLSEYYSDDYTTPFSRRFQWLPCDVDVSSNTPKIISYINNLHPKKHSELYGVLEQIIDKIIPLWNTTLTPLREFKFSPRIFLHALDYGDFEDYKEREGPKWEEDEGSKFYTREWEWVQQTKGQFLVQPEPGIFEPPTYENYVDLRGDYGHRGLQVIVKLANIYLTPEKPEYKGGSWHVEGKRNEHICASAIYYYDNENISPSYLAFRQASRVEEANEQKEVNGRRYGQGDWAWLTAIYGLENNEPAIQDMGCVESREGRIITFPNILQHRVQPFKLENPEKPGHRKILALFLVDPHIRVISTAHIPCQQKEWWAETMLSEDGPLGKLPLEVRLIIYDFVDFPLDFEKAKELRKKLMEERKKYNITEDNFGAWSVSLCEH